ncbi:hypothetical protein CEQ28_013650 [Hafnia alvei]|nr:hypothetical protein CEQ28_013650 [Hafnia alvei]
MLLKIKFIPAVPEEICPNDYACWGASVSEPMKSRLGYSNYEGAIFTCKPTRKQVSKLKKLFKQKKIF